MRFAGAALTIGLAVVQTPASGWAQAAAKCFPGQPFGCGSHVAVKSYVGAGTGSIISTAAGEASKACNDSDDCTTKLSGPISVNGLGNGQFQATLTVAWKSGAVSVVSGLACAAVAGSGSFDAGGVAVGGPVSGRECETAAGLASSPHTLSMVFSSDAPLTGSLPPFRAALGTGELTVSDFGIDQSTGHGIFVLDLTMAAQIFR